MDIKSSHNTDDVVTVKKSDHKEGHVYLEIGTGQDGDQRSRHVHLRASEAKAVAYALLSYTEQLSNG